MHACTTTNTTSQLPHGCASSSPTDASRPATLTSAASRTCAPTTCVDTANVIGSLGSAAGPSPWPLPDGRVIDQCGLVAALASLSPRQVREAGLQISGIYGRHGSTSSASAGLQASLESRLRAATDCDGSILYALTWKQRATPSGHPICALRAAARRTSGSGSTSERAGWPTPSATDHKGGYEGGRIRNGKLSTDRLDVCVQIAGWSTPRATDGSNGGPNQSGGALPADAARAGWPTPTATDANRGALPPRPQDTGIPLGQRVAMIDQDQPARITSDGTLLTGSTAGMESGGQLNPAHSRWLMGYPEAWCRAAVSAWRSMPTAQRRRA